MTTLGERRVRTTFNPSADSAVDLIKQKTAELINLCEEVVQKGLNKKVSDDKYYVELTRLVDIAQKSYEEAAMWAVKAATL